MPFRARFAPAFALVCAFAPPAAYAAVPHLLGYEGRLLRSDGTAATGTASATFAIYGAETGGTPLWSEAQTLGLSDGYYSTFLGLVTPQPDALFDGGARWLEVQVGAEILVPRQRIGSVPHAALAQGVNGGLADVVSLKIAGQTVVDAAGRLAGSARYAAGPGIAVEAASQIVSLQACAAGQTLVSEGTAWRCAASGSVGSVGASSPLAVTGTASAPVISIAQAGTGSGGFVSSSDWAMFAAKFDAATQCGGDLSGSLSAPVVARLQSRSMSAAAPAHGQVLKWNASTTLWEPSPDSDSGGTVRTVSVVSPLTSYNGSTTPEISIAAAGTSSDGYLSVSDWNRFDAKYGSDSVCGGDLAGTFANPRVAALRGIPIATAAPAAAQVLRYDGSRWAPAALVQGDVQGLSGTYVDLAGAQTIAGAKTFTSTIAGNISGNAATATSFTGSLAGDVVGTQGATQVVGIGGASIAASATTDGQVLRFNGATWIPSGLTTADIGGLSSAYVATAGAQTVDGAKTFTSVINGSISGNAATVTNGIYSNVVYSDPTWLGSLAGSKITGAVATASAFGGNLSGDVTGLQGTTLVGKLQGLPISASSPSAGQVLGWDGAAWTPAAPAIMVTSTPPASPVQGQMYFDPASNIVRVWAGPSTGWLSLSPDRMPTFTSGTPPGGTQGLAYTFSFAATDPQGLALTYSVASGTLPTGLTLATDGTLSGTPTAAGTYAFTVSATDTHGNAASQANTIVVAAPSTRSLRFRPGATAYLSRTNATAGTGGGKTWTYSYWLKYNATTSSPIVWGAGPASPTRPSVQFAFFTNAFNLQSYNGTAYDFNVTSVPVYRDPSAWYHFVIAFDSTQATAANRMLFYVNGQSASIAGGGTYPSLNLASAVGAAYPQIIGQHPWGGSNFDGYLAEMTFVDGQALGPSSFGQTDSTTGGWTPKSYGGAFGTNGFYLPFTDTASVGALVADKSGRGSNFTASGISLTAGATYDSMLDAPANQADGGNGRGNYATLNPVAAQGTLSNGNLDLTTSTANAQASTFFVNSGKWYWEVVWTAGSYMRIGVVNPAGQGADLGGSANGWCRLNNASRVYNNSSAPAYGTDPAVNDVQMVAMDVDAGKIWYGRNGTWDVSGNPGTGANPSQTFAANQYMSPALASGSASVSYSANFGQRPFSYAPPTGFLALNTQNLPTPATPKASSFMDIALWTGDGANPRSIGVGFQPDIVWIKPRSISTNGHILFDSVRGAGKLLIPNTSSVAEITNDVNGYVSAFNSNGFALTSGTNGAAGTNASPNTYVAWLWKKGAVPGVDVVTYTGNGTGQTVAHSLGVAPSLLVTRSRSANYSWGVYHKSLGATQALYLSLTQAPAATTNWNSTAPTSAVFSVGNANEANASGGSYVAYVFAEVPGFSKFGSYTGNGSADGPFVHTGFRPRYLLWRRADTTGQWYLEDSARSPSNVANTVLNPNLVDADFSDPAYNVDFLANGFKMRNSSAQNNASGGNFIYIAFAETPFKYATAR